MTSINDMPWNGKPVIERLAEEGILIPAPEPVKRPWRSHWPYAVFGFLFSCLIASWYIRQDHDLIVMAIIGIALFVMGAVTQRVAGNTIIAMAKERARRQDEQVRAIAQAAMEFRRENGRWPGEDHTS
jgi:hypothetical protein